MPQLIEAGQLARRYEWWDAADLRQKRVLLAEHVSGIVISRSQKPGSFDPSTVAIYGVGGEPWEPSGAVAEIG